MALYDQNSYSTLEEIIGILEKIQFPDTVYIGKNYSAGALIEDLKAIQKQERK